MIGSVPPPAPRFTVVMPTRGVRVPLPAALASVAAAAAAVGGDVEVVLVHDRRPGDPPLTTAKLAAPAGLADGCVRAIESTAPGLAAARNAGLEAARAAHVAFLDDDDLWLPGHLAQAADLFQRHPDLTLVVTDAWIFPDPTPDGSGVPPASLEPLGRFWSGRPEGDITLGELLRGNRLSASNVVLDRCRLAPGERFDPALGAVEDWALWLELARRHHRLRFDPRPGAIVRRWQGNMSRDRRRQAEWHLEVLRRFAAAGPSPDELVAAGLPRALGRAWLELGRLDLAVGDAAAARRAFAAAIAAAPLDPRNLSWWLVSLLPAPIRRHALGRGSDLRR